MLQVHPTASSTTANEPALFISSVQSLQAANATIATAATTSVALAAAMAEASYLAPASVAAASNQATTTAAPNPLTHPHLYDLSAHRQSISSTLSPPPSHNGHRSSPSITQQQRMMGDYRESNVGVGGGFTTSPDPAASAAGGGGSPYRSPSRHHQHMASGGSPSHLSPTHPSPTTGTGHESSPSYLTPHALSPPDEPGPSNWASQQQVASQLSQKLVGLGHQRAIETSASGSQRVLNHGLGGPVLTSPPPAPPEDDAMMMDGEHTRSWVMHQQQQQQQQQQQAHGHRMIDGRGDGDVVMQYSHPNPSQVSPQRSTRRRHDDGRLGVLPPDAPRSYTAIKLVGDGSFGTVWLCDWHSELDPSTTLSAMQCGAGARPEWVGKRLVAVKRMKRVWDGGWRQASALGELVSLRDIPHHPAIIPLYDAFLQPDTKELYFVFECMEGNLYQLTKSRKGRPLAGGLVASIFHQIVGGLHHIHRSGYFHRDMKPENLLVTTTGLQDYLPVIDLERHAMDAALVAVGKVPPERPAPRVEKDVTVIVKLADFGLARSLESKPPYTEYVSTRWYRAPEVLLRSKEYSAPVDMWALGTILAEIVNLKALFPGQSEVDQVWRICDVLGDPSNEYGYDSRGKPRGGGEWVRGIKMAKAVGFAFPKKIPVQFSSLFPVTCPLSLIDCIAELLRYNPRYRLTSEQCLDHPYFHLTSPHLKIASKLPSIPFSQGQPTLPELQKVLARMERQRMQEQRTFQSYSSEPPRALPPSHSASPVHDKPSFNSNSRMVYSQASNRSGSFPHLPETPAEGRRGGVLIEQQLRELDLPTADLSTYGVRLPGQPPHVVDQSRHSARSHVYGNHLHVGSTPEIAHTQQRAEFANKRHFESQPALAVSPAMSQESFQAPPVPAIPAHHQRSHLPPHMSTPTSLLSPNQQRWHDAPQPREDVAMDEPEPERSRAPPARAPAPPSAAPEPVAPLPIAGKKKKWGLSSVFGHNDSKADVGPMASSANIAPLSQSNSLKRSQSNLKVNEISVDPSMDPKKAKKAAERQAKELEKAKREAAERAQKERARAVMQKRNVLEQQRRQQGAKVELEWSTDAATLSRQMAQNASRASVVPKQAPVAPQSHADEPRSKARRRDDDGDHSQSTSRVDLGQMRNNSSVLTVGTIDSDPGPAGSPRQYPYSSEHHRATSQSSISLRHQAALQASSTASLDRQLAQDFRLHANVNPNALGGASTSSLGHYATSTASLSGPTTPYGQPLGHAVANGYGFGRTSGKLPSIADWEQLNSDVPLNGNGDAAVGAVNPMFRVPPTDPQRSLPPFSEIASVAGSIPRAKQADR